MAAVMQIGPMGFDKNFSYVVYGQQNNALLIDATGSREEIEKAIAEKGLMVVRQVITHAHPDHTENAKYFEEKGIPLISFEEMKKEQGFMIGSFLVRVIFTPGHTPDSVCFLIENNLFSGDTLFAHGHGRTDLAGSSQEEMNSSLKELSGLAPETIVWPGHDYGGKKTTLKEALAECGIK